jgi:hypothetical protein
VVGANESTASIIDALVSLGVQEYLGFPKIEGSPRSIFDFQRKRDDKYLDRFVGLIRLISSLLHDGRKQTVQSSKAPALTDDSPTTVADNGCCENAV